MCGIFAAISHQKKFEQPHFRLCEEALNKVSYRGPDAHAIITLNTNGTVADKSSFNILLGHRRLSIIDLSAAGNQPMVNNNCYIVFNGEIFNYIELRDELIKLGHTFSTHSDTEVILKTYEQFGADGFAKFNGMWSFVLVDFAQQKVIASRDRFSIKPLYFLHQDGQFYFASEIKQLTHLATTKTLNETVAYHFLQQQLLDYNQQTFFKEIQKVKPRHSLVIDLKTGEWKEQPYWDFEPVENVRNEKEAIETFRSLFIDSIKIRLRSDVKIGSLLSGGLDSSAITVFADSFQPGNFESFSVVSDNKRFSEEYFIDELVKHNHLLNSKLNFQSSQVPSFIDDVLFHQDEPFGSLSVVAQYLMFKQIKTEKNIKVILSGQGGDEIMMGYLKYFFFNLSEHRRKGRYDIILKEVLASLVNRTVLTQLEWNQVKRYMPSQANRRNNFLLLEGEAEKIWAFNSIRDRQQKDIDLYSIPALAHYEDRNSMASSIESRLPFLDHRVVNFLLGIPVNLKMKNGWTKYILRRSVHEMPETIRWRRDKKGFVTPEEIWLKGPLKEMVTKEFSRSLLHEAGIIDQKQFLQYYNDFLNGKQSDYSLIFRTFIFEKWMKLNFLN